MILKEMTFEGGLAWRFYCPGCKSFHMITSAGGWVFNGNMDKPTFSPSLVADANSNSVCHSFIRDGKIEYLSDSHHVLAGQTVDLPSFNL